MVLTPRPRNRALEVTIAILGAGFLGAAVWFLIGVDARGDARLVLLVFAAITAAGGFGLLSVAVAAGDALVWSVEDGVLVASWTRSRRRDTLPLKGAVQMNAYIVEDPESPATFVLAMAVVESSRHGRVELWQDQINAPPASREAWGSLVLRGHDDGCDLGVRREGARCTLESGWSPWGRVAAVCGLLLPILPCVIALRGAPLAIVAGVVLAGFPLLRTFAVLELRRFEGRLEVRRRAVVPLGPWRALRRPEVLDLTGWPRVEWRDAEGRTCLVFHGGPEGLSPAGALHATAWLRSDATPSKLPDESSQVIEAP